jgi:hypothetical protein
MAKFRVEYEMTGAAEWARGVVFVTEVDNRSLSEVEQFVNYAKNPEQAQMGDLQTAWKNRKILRVERVSY